MATKYQLEQMLDKSIESANRLTEHISELWIEIGRKQDRVHDLNYEIS